MTHGKSPGGIGPTHDDISAKSVAGGLSRVVDCSFGGRGIARKPLFAGPDRAVRMRMAMVSEGRCCCRTRSHGGRAYARPEVLWIGRDRDQRLGRRAEQRVVDHRLILVGDGSERFRFLPDDPHKPALLWGVTPQATDYASAPAERSQG